MEYSQVLNQAVTISSKFFTNIVHYIEQHIFTKAIITQNRKHFIVQSQLQTIPVAQLKCYPSPRKAHLATRTTPTKLCNKSIYMLYNLLQFDKETCYWHHNASKNMKINYL